MEPVPEPETTATEATQPATSTEPAEAPVEPAAEAPVEPAAEAPVEPAAEAPVESTTEAPVEPAAEAPVESTAEAPVEPAAEAPVESTTEAPVESTEAPVESTTEAPVESTETPVESTETPVEPVVEAPVVVREPDPQPEDQPTAPILNNLNPDVSFPLSLAYKWGRPINSATIPVTMYRVNIEGSDGTNETIDLSSNVFSYTFYNMVPYVSYTTSVRASSNNGEGFGPRAFYNTANPVAQVYNPPASANAIVVEPDCIVVEWTAPLSPPFGTYKYEIYCINDSYFVPTRKGVVESVQFVYQFDDLDPSAGYTFYVRVVNNVSASQPTYTQHVDPRV